MPPISAGQLQNVKKRYRECCQSTPEDVNHLQQTRGSIPFAGGQPPATGDKRSVTLQLLPVIGINRLTHLGLIFSVVSKYLKLSVKGARGTNK